jgi:energy-coupling factor transporter ATP-binding protein EcfA2
MRDRIKLSESATSYLFEAKRNMNLGGEDDYIPMRIAFGYSLQTEREPTIKVIEKTEPEISIKKKELLLSTFVQTESQGLLFQSLLSQRYKRKIDGDEYVELLTKHIEHGLWMISEETKKLKGYDYLLAILEKSAHTEQKYLDVTPTFEDKSPEALTVKIGRDKITGESISYNINLTTEHTNPHFAIIGMSGSGKTTFVKHLLRQIRTVSNFKTNFIIFDYKDGDIARDERFIAETKAEVIDLKKTPLPLNLFWQNTGNEREQKECAERIVDIVKNVEAHIGKVQEQNLYDAIISAYQKSSPYPDFESIRSELERINDKPDSLTSVLRPLTEQNYFSKVGQRLYETWTNRTLIIDIHEITKKELVCFFVLNQLNQEFKKLGGSPMKDNIRFIRTVIVIDEAHYFLENTKRAKVLAKMIREVRSAGGSVVLASQSPDDYDKAEFDFLEQIEFPIVLKSTPKSGKFLEQKFGLSPTKARETLSQIGTFNAGEAFVFYQKKPLLVELAR